MATKERPLSPTAQKALDFLKESDRPLTLAEIKEIIVDINASHLGALVNRGHVVAEKVEIEVPTIAKRKVNQYAVIK